MEVVRGSMRANRIAKKSQHLMTFRDKLAENMGVGNIARHNYAYEYKRVDLD